MNPGDPTMTDGLEIDHEKGNVDRGEGKILIIDDDIAFASRLAIAMEARELKASVASSVNDAINHISRHSVAYVTVDLRVGADSGLRVLQFIQDQKINARAIVLTGYGSIATAVTAVKLGAVDYLIKVCTADEVYLALTQMPGHETELANNLTSPSLAKWEYIKSVYEMSDRNISKAARHLNLNRRTLQRMLSRHAVH
jgi:two-component system response regulator RegA